MTKEIVPSDVVGFDVSILAGGVSESSQKMYARDFSAYLEFAGTPENAINAKMLARWRVHLAANTKHSPNTINRMLSSVKTLMRSAEEQGYVPDGTWQAFELVHGVKVSAMKRRTRPNARTPIAPKDMRKLADSPDERTLLGMRDRALLHTLGTSGLRIQELATLMQEQIATVDNGYQLRVMGKNDTEYRNAPLSAEAYGYIMCWIQSRPIASEYLFTSFAGRGDQEERITPRAMTPMSVWRTVKRYAARVGLRNIKPHDFRRFVGTELAAKSPRAAQKALGHKKIGTTMDNYVLDTLEVGLTDKLF